MERKISPYQLLASMFVLPYGSAILFYLASEAKQDSWIAILVYIIPAILLILVHIKLFSYYPEDTIVTYLPKIFGKLLGNLLSIIYILYFLYLATRVLRDFSSLIVYSSMGKTPHLFIAAFIMLVVVYGMIVGIEPLCRASEILFPLMLIGLLLAVLLLLITKNVLKFEKIFPILENGFLFTMQKSWRLITFPYGELVAFSMAFKNVNEPHKIRKIAVIAVIVEGVTLSIINFLFITGLGPAYAAITSFPLLETLRLIRVGGFLDRLDILIIVTMVVAGFMKISFFMYFASFGIRQLFKIKQRKKTLALILGIVIFFSSEIIAKNFPQHLKIGLDVTVTYIHLPLQIFIPLTALIVAFFKHKKSSQTSK